MAGRTSLDLVRQVSGEDDPAAAVRALDDRRVDTLVELITTSPPAPTVEPTPNELRPVISARSSGFATGGGRSWFVGGQGAAGVNLMAAVDPRASGTGQFPNAILRALLYCHGLLIEDPLAIASAMYVEHGAGDMRPVARKMVIAAASSVVEVAVLVDAGIVQTYAPSADHRPPRRPIGSTGGLSHDEVWDAFEAMYVEGLAPALAELWRAVRGGDRSPPLDLVRRAADQVGPDLVSTFIDALAALKPSVVVENVIDSVRDAVGQLARLGGFDLWCPAPLFARLAVSDDPGVDMRLHELAAIEVPRIDDLLVEDAIAIRMASDAFALWRSRLAVGLERARASRERGEDVDAVAVVGEVLADARAGLFRETERSRTLSPITRAGLTFSSGALGGAVSGSSGGTTGAVIGALGGIAGAVALALIDAGDPLPGYLHRHYVLFDRRPDTSPT